MCQLNLSIVEITCHFCRHSGWSLPTLTILRQLGNLHPCARCWKYKYLLQASRVMMYCIPVGHQHFLLKSWKLPVNCKELNNFLTSNNSFESKLWRGCWGPLEWGAEGPILSLSCAGSCVYPRCCATLVGEDSLHASVICFLVPGFSSHFYACWQIIFCMAAWHTYYPPLNILTSESIDQNCIIVTLPLPFQNLVD